MAGKKFILPAIGVAAIVAGGTVAYLHFNRSTGDAANPQAFAKVIPDDAYMATFVSSNPQTWAKLQQFGTPEAQKVVGQGLTQFQQKLGTDAKIDYDKDLKPWVGDVMIALLPSQTQAPSEKPNMLIVVGIKDKASALNFANKMKNESKVKSTESDYKGVKIADYPGEKGSTYTAVLKDYLVLAGEQKTIEQAIDTVQGKPSLASKPGADSLLAKGVEVQNPLARIYFPDYATAIQQFAVSGKQATPLSPQTIAQLKQVKSVVAAIGVDEAGLRLKANASLDPQTRTVEFKPAAGTIVGQFPADTLALVSGAGINYYWSQVVEGAKSSPNTQQTIDRVRQQMSTYNLDLDKDIFGWMDGEFALAMIPSNQGLLGAVGFGGALVIDTSNRQAAEAALTKFDTLAKSSGYVNVGQRDAQGKKITEWQTPQGAIVEHGWLDQDSVFVTLGPLANTIATKPSPALDSSDTFKAATSSLPKQNMGYFYLDMDKTMSLVNRTVLAAQSNAIPPETAAVLNSIRGIGITSTQMDKTTGQFELLLALKPAK